MSSTAQVSAKELVALAAADFEFYGRTFFPKTFKSKSPIFHRDLTDVLEDRNHRFNAFSVFRDGAKTSLLRVYVSRRIAYGTSKLIAFVGAAQEHPKTSLHWLRRHIDHNSKWCQVYGLRKGGIWTDEKLEIVHERFGHTVTVLAVGISGQIRGINIDDDRPDLIVLDDPCNEENTATAEARLKTENLVFGALLKGLAKRSEVPDAKMALLQTPLHKEDLLAKCIADKAWTSRVYGCFDDNGESSWPERMPTAELLQDKQTHIANNRASLWSREMECKVIAPEDSSFKPEWLKFWTTLPEKMSVYMAIDPVPPPSEKALAMGLHKKDYEAFVVVGRAGKDFYLLDFAQFRGHTPEWTKATFFRLLDKWRPLKVRMEAVAYQRVLKHILEEAMASRGRFVQLDTEPDDKVGMTYKILQEYSGIASQGRLYIHNSMIDFVTQFNDHPNCTHDDLLAAGAMALRAAGENAFTYGEFYEGEDEEEEQEVWRAAP